MGLRAALAGVYLTPRFCTNGPSHCTFGGACRFLHKRAPDEPGILNVQERAAGQAETAPGRTAGVSTVPSRRGPPVRTPAVAAAPPAAFPTDFTSLASCPFCAMAWLPLPRLAERLRHCLRDCISGPRLSRMCAVSMPLLLALCGRSCQQEGSGASCCQHAAERTALKQVQADPSTCPLGCGAPFSSPTTLYGHVLCECPHGPQLPRGVYDGSFDCIEAAAVRYLANTDVDDHASETTDANEIEAVAGSAVVSEPPLPRRNADGAPVVVAAASDERKLDDFRSRAAAFVEELRRRAKESFINKTAVFRSEPINVNGIIDNEKVVDNAFIAHAWVWEQDGDATPPENFHLCPLCGRWLLNREQMVFHAVRRCVLGPANQFVLPTEKLLVTHIAELLTSCESKALATTARDSPTFHCHRCPRLD